MLTDSLESRACKRERKPALTLAGNPLYNVSRIFGGNEVGRDAYKKIFNPIYTHKQTHIHEDKVMTHETIIIVLTMLSI